jgi:CO/xanthine dehydrogenase Mo-binding subunit
LPVVTDPFEALKPGAATVHEPLGSNLAFEKTLSFGDVDGDFASADRVIRRTLRWHRASAQPLETAGALCRFDPVSQRMDVWSNTNMINYVGWLLAARSRCRRASSTSTPCTWAAASAPSTSSAR